MTTAVKQTSFKWCGRDVALYTYPKTGFSVVLASGDGPITHGFFVIATGACGSREGERSATSV